MFGTILWLLPIYINYVGDVANPRVQAHAGAALVNFSEDCPKMILTKYLEDIMKKLEGILNDKFKQLVETGTKLVLEQVRTITENHVNPEKKMNNFQFLFRL